MFLGTLFGFGLQSDLCVLMQAPTKSRPLVYVVFLVGCVFVGFFFTASKKRSPFCGSSVGVSWFWVYSVRDI